MAKKENKVQRTNKCQQNTTKKTKDWATQASLKRGLTHVVIKYSWMVVPFVRFPLRRA
jgi:hypothetical protein